MCASRLSGTKRLESRCNGTSVLVRPSVVSGIKWLDLSWEWNESIKARHEDAVCVYVYTGAT